MDKKAFGFLVATLRKEMRNEFDGILSQYDLAELAQMPKVALQKIEQGRYGNLSPATVMNLASALHLPTRARQIFFLASLGLPDGAFMKQPLSAPALLAKLSGLLAQYQSPVMIADAFGDVIISTPAWLEVFDLNPEEIRAPQLLSQHNLYRYLFAPEFSRQRAMLGESQHDFLHRMVLIFKMISLKYRAHWWFIQLLPELNRSPLFQEHWQSPFYQDDDIINTLIPFSLKHPRLGQLKLLVSPQVTLSGYGDLYLYNFQPLDERTGEACAQLIRQFGNRPFQNLAWPKAERQPSSL